MNNQAKTLFTAQMQEWEAARKNFEDLQKVETKHFAFNGFEVRVQFNPARMISSCAKTDVQTLAARPCFLCQNNRSTMQRGIVAGNYEMLINPFPIFPQHFTIASCSHTPQIIEPYFADLLCFARILSDFVVFFNGAGCGASAPDHLHFQAGTKDFLPLFTDYKHLKNKNAIMIKRRSEFEIFTLKSYLRSVFCIEASCTQAAEEAFDILYGILQANSRETPKMNIICYFENGKYFIFIFPRRAARPQEFYAPPDKQLLVSCGSVEMGGNIITPVREHFERITKNDIESIYRQVSI